MLLLKLSAFAAALPLAEVEACMRPLPVMPLSDVPAGVLGLCVIGGQSLPVIDLEALLGGAPAPALGRFVVVRAGGRRLALAVQEVSGVARLEPGTFTALPPLLEGVRAEAAAVRDQSLTLLLSTARLIPPALWQALQGREASA